MQARSSRPVGSGTGPHHSETSTNPLALPLPSRARLMARCWEHLDPKTQTNSGLSLAVVGPHGSGKTWIARTLSQRDQARTWIQIDLSPGLTPRGFYQRIGYRLGLVEGSTANPPDEWTRSRIRNYLATVDLEGERLVLILDEAHLLQPQLAEEIRILDNELGQPEGFDALVLIGQTTLAHRLIRGDLRHLADRLIDIAIVPPVDIEEVMDWCKEALTGSVIDRDQVEDLVRSHRNLPGSLLRDLLAMANVASATHSSDADERSSSTMVRGFSSSRPVIGPRLATETSDRSRAPDQPLIESESGPLTDPSSSSGYTTHRNGRIDPVDQPMTGLSDSELEQSKESQPRPWLRTKSWFGGSRPPLRVEDGLIEVGFEDSPDPVDDSLPTEISAVSDPSPSKNPESSLHEEADVSVDIAPEAASPPIPDVEPEPNIACPTATDDLRDLSSETEGSTALSEPVPTSTAEQAAPNSQDRIVRDHYATLQAWQEWTTNQGRSPESSSDSNASPAFTPTGSQTRSVRPDGSVIWAEPPHRFAPYSQLFANRRSPRDHD